MSEEEALYLKVFGNNKNKVISKKISLPLYLDNEYIGLAWVTLENKNGKDKLFANKMDFATVLQSVLKEETYQEYLEKIQKLNKDEIEIEKITCCGISYTYDEQALAIYIHTFPSVRKKKTIVFRKFNKLITKDSVFSSDISGVVNLYFNQAFRNNKEHNSFFFEPLRIQINPFINLYGYVIENKFHANYYKHTHEFANKDFEIKRDSTVLSKVIQDKNMKLSLGDIQSQKAQFNSSNSILGMSIEKKKSQYNFNKRETTRVGQTTLFLENDSKVELYVNGVKKSTLRLKAGTHDLVDFAMETGLNNIEIKIEDIYGKVSYIQYSDFFYGQLLKEGESEYGISLGVLSQTQDESIEYFNDILFGSSYYKQGFSDFTLSLSLQKSNTSYVSFGGKILFPTSYGLWEYSQNLTSFNHLKGDRKELGYAFTYKKLSFDFSSKLTSSDYINFSSKITPLKKSSNIRAALGYKWKRANHSLSFSRIKTTSSLLNQYGYSLSYPLSKRISSQLRLTHKDYLIGENEDNTSLYLSFTWRPKSNQYRLQNTNTVDNNEQKYAVSLNGKMPFKSDYINSNYGLSAQKSKEYSSYSSSLSYNNQSFLSSLSLDVDKNEEYYQKNGRVSFSTGFAFINNRVAQTIPITGNFIYVDNISDIKQPLSLYGFDSQQQSSVHSFPAFSIKKLRVNEKNLPFNLQLTKNEFNIVSAYKAGIYIPLKIQKRVILRMYLKDKEIKSIGARPITIINDKTKETFETFSNKQGRVVYSDAILNESYTIKTDEHIYKMDLSKLHDKSKRLYSFKRLLPYKQ
jgi:outer membrane usher protein FimD/PapC